MPQLPQLFKNGVKNSIMTIYFELVMRRVEGEDVKLFLSPKQILYILGLYKPSTPAKQKECAWLKSIREEMREDGFEWRPAKKILARNPRQNLNVHLHDLVQMGILTRKCGRYGPGLSFGKNPFFYERVKETILSEGPKGFYTEDGIIAFVRSKSLRTKDLDRDSREEIMKKAYELVDLTIDRYNRLRARNPIKDENGPGRKLPLIVIDPNQMLDIKARLTKNQKDQAIGDQARQVVEELRRVALEAERFQMA